MAQNVLGRNMTFPIYSADGSPFHDLAIHKATVDSVVMSLGDKITGDVYYKDNKLAVTMNEYIEYDPNPDDPNVDPIKYVLVNPPTIIREGMVSDNSGLNGMTKYSFTFYHPMYMLGNFPFTDVAVDPQQSQYLSQNKTFSWIGNLTEFVAKLDANLAGTEWKCVLILSSQSEIQKAAKVSDVLSFSEQFVSDAMKTAYDTWEIPFTITSIASGEQYYSEGKRFLITFGLPSQEILGDNNQPYVFRFGQGLGLKNNSRTPKNNKIVTRIVGYGSDRNIPYGYPQIIWTGNQDWNYTINNDPAEPNSYPIYSGIVGGQYVRLIKHPFTRTTLQPSIYRETVNKKVNPLATGYDPNTVIIDYYDAVSDAGHQYVNQINPLAPSVEIHQFEDTYPHLSNATLAGVSPYQDSVELISKGTYNTRIQAFKSESSNENEKAALQNVYDNLETDIDRISNIGGSYTFEYLKLKSQAYTYGNWYHVKYTSGNVNFEYYVYAGAQPPVIDVEWDDTMNDEGEYVQSYFKLTLPQLSFDLYACASITEEMEINMRSGQCLGCTFPIYVDWEDYKRNFFHSDGTFDPVIHTEDGDGHVRDGSKYPNSQTQQIDVIVKKDNETFGTLMPNSYQQPHSGDQFVVLGISLPQSYVLTAETELDGDMKEYMLENNIHYFDYPVKVDEHFLATHTNILAQIKNNSIFRFVYGDENMVLYVKQITIKYGDKPLPQYDITLTDDIEIVLNQIGQVTDDVSRLRLQMSELQKYYGGANGMYISKITDDVAQGRITFQQGLDALASVVLHDEIRSAQFETGLYDGRGWRIDHLGNAEMESLRVRSYLEVVELLINRLQAQEGDTLFTDNDQIDKVDKVIDPSDGTVSYILSLKEKWEGYFTSQMYGNVLKGIINTLAAKEAGVSDETNNNPSKQGTDDGGNKYYTSWMRVVETMATTGSTLGKNQIRVILYGDNEVPAQRNFEPCELMTLARWGCINYGDPDDATLQASIARRQRVFMISTSDGRVIKYNGVDRPILQNWNYGVTIGELPEFVKNYTEVRKILDVVGEHTDWVYAQGIVVENYVKVSREGKPVSVTVYCGDWIDANPTTPVTLTVWDEATQTNIQLSYPIPAAEYEKNDSPYIGHGIYFYNKYNARTQQYETHEVRHIGGRWQCLQSQPVKSGNTYTFNEPRWDSSYWRLVDGNDNLSIEFVSSRGLSFRRGFVDTIITPHLFYGNVDISADVAAENWDWTRESESGKTVADETWDAQHEGMRMIHLGNEDMPATWSSQDKAIFTCTVTVDDGKSTRIVQNQIIS